MLSLLSALPSPTTTLEQASIWTNAFFGEFSWIIGITVGIAFFGLAIPWLINKIINGIRSISDKQNIENYWKQKRTDSEWIQQHIKK